MVRIQLYFARKSRYPVLWEKCTIWFQMGRFWNTGRMTDGESYWGEDYTLAFLRDHTLNCNPFHGTEMRLGTWELSDDTIMIFWDDGEMDEATLDPENPDSLTLHSTGEILAKLF